MCTVAAASAGSPAMLLCKSQQKKLLSVKISLKCP